MNRAGHGLPFLAKLDLSLRLRHGGRSALIAAAAGLVCGLYIGLADATLLRSAVPEMQHTLIREWPLAVRLPRFLVGALTDEVVLRLLGLSAVLWLTVVIAGRRTGLGDGIAILFTAAVLWPLYAQSYLTLLDWSGLTVLRELCLHVSAGALWGWLYCRHGWLAGVIGHCSAQLALQSALTLL